MIGIYNCLIGIEWFNLVYINVWWGIDSFVLVLVDFDDFKLINDNFGYSVGDEVFKVFVKIV